MRNNYKHHIMNNEFVSVHFKASEEKAAIISAFLFDMGYDGLQETDEAFIISIQRSLFNEDDLKTTMDAQHTGYTLEITKEQNWNEQWERSFEPVQVDDFALIRASFHQPKSGVRHDIIITPKMSFGTGHHATTYLMMQLMREIDFSGKSVIDFGTGTGVLAILAEKLGAIDILAIDNDEWSIRNSEENIGANHCKNIRLELAQQMVHHQKAAIILANINLNVIVANLQNIKDAAAPEALVLFSGLMTEDEEIIRNHLKNNGFHIQKIEHRNGWIALLTKPELFPQD